MLTFISLLLFIASSAFLVWFFLKHDRGPKEPRGALFAAAGFGLLAIMAAFWAEMFLLPKPDSPTLSIFVIFLLAMGVGVIEESAKFVPLALFIRGKNYFNEHTDGVIYFGIVGLTFGFVENLLYLFVYKNQLGGSQLTGIFRLIVLFFFHAASTGIVGYYFAKAKIQKQKIIKPIIALITMMFIHGTYDFLFLAASHTYQNNPYASDNTSLFIVLALVGGLIISALLNTFLFLYYGRARQWDASIGLATDPNLPASQQVALSPQPTANPAVVSQATVPAMPTHQTVSPAPPAATHPQ